MRERIIFLLLFLFCSGFPNSYSQINFVVTPLKAIHTVQKGKPYTGTFTLENFSDKIISISVSVEDFDIDEKTGEVVFQSAGTHKNSLSKYIVFSPTKIDLKPYQKQKIKYVVNFPSNLQGSFWSAVFFTSRPTERLKGTGIKIAARIGSYVFCTTGEGAISNLRIEKFTIEDNSFLLLLENLGNAISVPEISFKISESKGKTIQTEKIENRVLLPYKKRDFKIQIKDIDKVKPGWYNAEVFILYGNRTLKETLKFVAKKEFDKIHIETRE